MSAHLASVSEECQTDSGVSAPGPGAGRRRAEGNLWELVLSTTQAGGRREEGGAGRDRSRDGHNVKLPSCCLLVWTRTANSKTCPRRVSCESGWQVGRTADRRQCRFFLKQRTTLTNARCWRLRRVFSQQLIYLLMRIVQGFLDIFWTCSTQNSAHEVVKLEPKSREWLLLGCCYLYLCQRTNDLLHNFKALASLDSVEECSGWQQELLEDIMAAVSSGVPNFQRTLIKLYQT